MDDRNFRKELHSLKQQVNILSPKYKPITRHMASTASPQRLQDDPFTAQLHDVNAQMTSMEDTMRELKRRLERPVEAAKVPIKAPNGDEMTTQRHISLPSGPVFWQLFNSLRTDLRTIDGRVAALERSVSDLEDRVDGLEPTQFTPASSATTSEVGCSQPTQEGPTNTEAIVDYRPCMLPELYKDMNSSQGCLPIPAEQPYWQMPYGPPPPMSRPLVYPNILHPHQEIPVHHYEQYHPQYEASLRSDTATAGANINHLHQQNDAIQGRIDKIDRENEIMLQAIRNLTQRLDRPLRQGEQVQAELPSRPWPKTFETPEVRFRDREIDRMDELLRATQERLRLTEESTAQKDASIARLRTERDEQRARESAERTNQMREQLAHVCDTLDGKNAEIGDLHDQLEQRNDALQKWQQSWNELSDSHGRADEQVTSYKHAYYDSMVSKLIGRRTSRPDDCTAVSHHPRQVLCSRVERPPVYNPVRFMRDMLTLLSICLQVRADRDIQKITLDHEDETAKLKEFCEQKDIVIQRQEDVIARGAKLLEQRDAEIEETSLQLRAAEDDRRHSRRTQDRLSKLLHERDDEIEQLKRDLITNSAPRDAKAATSDRSSVITWDDPLPVRDDQSWTSYRLPERTREDDGGETNNHPWVQVGGSPLQFQKMPSAERHIDEAGPSEDYSHRNNGSKKRSKRQRHSHRQYPELNRQPAGPAQSPRNETWPWRAETREPAPAEQGRNATANERTQSYWAAPLPAPVTARRMMSDANLHSRAVDPAAMRAVRSLSKHHSMQELPKSRLQAYAESEPESGGEVGKKV